MRSIWLACQVLVASAAVVRAQTAREFQFQAERVATGTRFVGAGVGAAIRTPGRTRIGLTLSAGAVESDVGGRGALLLSYHLRPFARQGVTPYAGGGISAVIGTEAREYLVIVLGLEGTPGARRGWFVEAGLAGGVVLTAGVRMRWRSVTS